MCHQYPPSGTGALGALSPRWVCAREREAADAPRKQLTRMLSEDLKMTIPLKLCWEEILWMIIYVDSDTYNRIPFTVLSNRKKSEKP